MRMQNSHIPRFALKTVVALGGAFTSLLSINEVWAQTPQPVTPPPTGLQSPVPAPALPLPKAGKPLLVSPELPASFKGRPLTLNEVVAISLVTNRTLALAGANLLRAQGRMEEAQTAFNPNLSASLNYLRLNQGINFELSPGNSVNFVNEQQRSITVQATLPIDISGMLKVANDQAKFGEIGARLDVNRLRNQIVLDVKTGFYDALRAQALTAVAEENLKNSQGRLEDADKKFQAGVVAKFDVIRAQTDVANARQQWIQARNTLSLSIASLNNVMGVDINAALQLTNEGALETPPDAPTDNPPASTSGVDTEPRIPSQAYDPIQLGADYEKLAKEALEMRPEFWQAEANLAAAKKGVQLAQRSVLPAFNLNWSLNYTPDQAGFAPQIVQWQATAQISLPLYDGGTARARRHSAKAEVVNAEVSRRDTQDRILLEVRQAYLNLLQARDRVMVSNQGLTQAREGFRLAKVRYNAGVSAQAGISPLLEVSDAQAALTLAESNQVNALYDYNSARARLDRSVGRYSYSGQGQGYAAPPKKQTTHK